MNHCGLSLHVALVARLPAAAVNPEDDRQVLRVRRGVDVEHLPLVAVLDVGDVALGGSGLPLDLEHECGGNGDCDGGSHGAIASLC